MMQWYCAYTQPQRELWARTSLWERGFEVYLPRYRKQRRHARKTELVGRPLFPRYLFVQADFESQSPRAVRSAAGVVDLVRMGAAPSTVDAGIVAEIRAREAEDGYVRLGRNADFKTGETVRVTAGSLCDQTGLITCTSDDQRVFILMNLLGREVRVRVAADDLARAL
jgi:transcriptional antiterminator RfaH